MTDGQLDGQLDKWTVGQDGGNGQEGVVGQHGQVGQVRRVGTGGRVGGGRTGTGCPSMNAARGRRPKNARSTEIRRSQNNHTFKYLYSMFTNRHVYEVLQSSVHYMDG